MIFEGDPFMAEPNIFCSEEILGNIINVTGNNIQCQTSLLHHIQNILLV